ncbi:hypothetical protein AB833_12525 [Chromatiales bacterium (ex Bugula neritina AB1)]|nr:hypothetical protein AB833_12525 [Chromatiales bacterium (ex Bugula neritina AB1)]
MPYPFGEWIVRHARAVFAVSLILTLVAMAGMSKLQNNPDNRVFFGKDNPQLQALELLEETYTRTDNVFIALAPSSGEVFNSDTLNVIMELTEAAWQIPFSSRVDSLSNFQHTRAEGNDDLVVNDLIDQERDLSAAYIEQIKQIALGKPFLVNRLISEDTSVAGLNVTILKPEDNSTAVYEVAAYAGRLVEDFSNRYPQIEFYITGGTLYDVAFSDLPAGENKVLVPAMFGLILITVGLALRTVWATVTVLMLIAASVGVAMGMTGWAGAVLNAGTAGAPVIIPTLCVAHCVHLMVTIRQRMAKGYEQRDAIIESLRVNTIPILITSITTAIGFLSLNFSDAPPFRLLGNIVAFGVLVGCVLSLTLLPAVLTFTRLKKLNRKPVLAALMASLGNTVVRFHRSLLWIMGALIVLLTLGTTKITLDDNFLEYFSDKFEITRHTNFVEDRLTGLNAIEYSLPATDAGGVSDPHYLADVDQFVEWLGAQKSVTNVGAISHVMKELNQSMHGDDPAYYRLPESRELAAQYLLMYEMSLPYGLDLNNTIDVSKSQSRVIALIRDASSAEMRELNARAEQWLQKHTPDRFVQGSGLSMIFAYVSERNINSMLFGSLIALVAISFMLILALRSVKIGLVSLLPNLVPAAMALGIWGYVAGEVGLSVAIVVAITLGIVVDDTVHFLSKYLRARREQGMRPEEAIKNTFETVGVALVITSIALMAGFAVLYFSGFKVNSEMGLLSAVTIVIALIADFFFLPAVLLKVDRGNDDSSAGF